MKVFLDFDDLVFLGESNHGLYFRALPPDRLGLKTRWVALKVLVRDASEAQWRAVACEIQLLCSIESPWIVRLYEAGHNDGRLYFAMEYALLGTLARPVRALSEVEKIRALANAVRGLQQLHDRGVIHRDFKPAKVLVHDRGGRLNDLGIAGFADERLGRAIPTGSIGFMAPEVARGERATRASDIFGVGATLHLLLTGVSVYQNVPRRDLLAAVRYVARDLPVVAALPGPLEDLTRACLAVNPGDRPTSAGEVADQLDRIVRSGIGRNDSRNAAANR